MVRNSLKSKILHVCLSLIVQNHMYLYFIFVEIEEILYSRNSVLCQPNLFPGCLSTKATLLGKGKNIKKRSLRPALHIHVTKTPLPIILVLKQVFWP